MPPPHCHNSGHDGIQAASADATHSGVFAENQATGVGLYAYSNSTYLTYAAIIANNNGGGNGIYVTTSGANGGVGVSSYTTDEEGNAIWCEMTYKRNADRLAAHPKPGKA
jgi:hypothetical protein